MDSVCVSRLAEADQISLVVPADSSHQASLGLTSHTWAAEGQALRALREPPKSIIPFASNLTSRRAVLR
eukprot:4688713-Amphidinium_carterae.1